MAHSRINRHYYKEILAIALPMIASALSVPLLGVVDTAIMGHLDSPVYLGAINVGVTAFNLFLWGLGFLRMSTTGLVAQAHGRGDRAAVARHLVQALLLALALAMTLLLLAPFWIDPLIRWFASDHGAVQALASTYMHWRLWSLPASLWLFVMMAFFLAIQRARVVLQLMLVSQVGNMLLDYFLVVHWHWKIEGVAAGSVISEYLALLLGLWHLARIRILQALPKTFWRQWRLQRRELLQLLAFNRDIFIRTVCLMFVFAFFTRQSASQGEVILAANAVLLNFFYLASYGLDGFAHAVESLAGHYYGRGDKNALRQVIRDVFTVSWAVAAALSASYWLAGEGMIHLLTDLPAVRHASMEYLRWVVLLPLVAVASFVYDGLCVATLQTRVMRNSMLVATLFCFVPLWMMLRSLGNDGLWLAFLAFFIVRGLAIHLYFKRSRVLAPA
jgi:MATE family multidrug resistance protein